MTGLLLRWEGPGGLTEEVRVGRGINEVRERLSRGVLSRGTTHAEAPSLECAGHGGGREEDTGWSTQVRGW